MEPVDVFISREDLYPWIQCKLHPHWRFIENILCGKGCNWTTGSDCLNCKLMGAFNRCPCMIAQSYRSLNPASFQAVILERWRRHDAQPSTWLIVHPTANLQRERNIFQAAQLWKVIEVSDTLTLIGSFYSAGITEDKPVKESA
jgi:hypothetical protein